MRDYLKLIDIGGPWRVLRPGIHDSTLAAIEARFATTDHRQKLFSGFQDGTTCLFDAGCKNIYLDGSFVTEKQFPGDFDACWDPTGVDLQKLNPVLLDFKDMRKRQKERFLGEFFPTSSYADNTTIFLDFFQIDKYTGNSKGVICIHAPGI